MHDVGEEEGDRKGGGMSWNMRQDRAGLLLLLLTGAAGAAGSGGRPIAAALALQRGGEVQAFVAPHRALSCRWGVDGGRGCRGRQRGPAADNAFRADGDPAAAAVFGFVHGVVVGALLLSPVFARGVAAFAAAGGETTPFFDGWFIRLTDAAHNASCAVIVGSLRHAGAAAFTEHYVALSYSSADMARHGSKSPDELQSVHVFPEPADVEISMDGTQMRGALHETDWRAPAAGRVRDFRWLSHTYGSLVISSQEGDRVASVRLNFSLPGVHGETVSLSADLTHPVQWAPNRGGEAGPEGWLGRLGFLLPCRYFVQSLGSSAQYSLRRVASPPCSSSPSVSAPRSTLMPARDPAGIVTASPAGAGAAGPVQCVGNGRGHWPKMQAGVSGRAVAHVETNYGSCFPSGWVYIQVVSASLTGAGRADRGAGPVSVLVTGGEFGIGPVSPLTYIVAVRAPAVSLNFRTTDLSMVKVSFSCSQRRVRLVARGALGYGRVDLVIKDSVEKHDEEAVWVPTRAGFSRSPGCSESFGATCRIIAWGTEVPWHRHEQQPPRRSLAALDCELPFAALEFGGSFQSDRPDLQADLPPSPLW